MKTRFISFFLFMLTMSCFVACSSDDPAPEPEPEPEPQGAEEGLDVLWYSAPDGVLTTFDGKRTVIAIPADAPNLPRGAQAVLREIDGRPYLIFPR